jgi:hypothetical protein
LRFRWRFRTHGWSEYDSHELKLTGKIVEAGYEHPHGRQPQVRARPGRWCLRLTQRRGLEKGALKPGAMATVVGYPNRNKPEEMRAERIIIDGKTVELR